jgi:hypothetical protein
MLTQMQPALLRLILLAMLLLCTSCSDFDRRWKLLQAPSTHRDFFSGSYEGTWESTRYKGASGKLWCILTQQGPGVYQAEFRATWHGIFSSRHTVNLRITDRKGRGANEVVRFTGATEIRIWVGSGHYRCDGEITPAGLVADYDAEIDRGKFTLSRVRAPRPSQP